MLVVSSASVSWRRSPPLVRTLPRRPATPTLRRQSGAARPPPRPVRPARPPPRLATLAALGPEPPPPPGQLQAPPEDQRGLLVHDQLRAALPQRALGERAGRGPPPPPPLP